MARQKRGKEPERVGARSCLTKPPAIPREPPLTPPIPPTTPHFHSLTPHRLPPYLMGLATNHPLKYWVLRLWRAPTPESPGESDGRSQA
ncbi:hypothetical protein K2D_37510 [Planctomycetes bacterium K2D]|uniref:Uncharacterized protein n=1 Tax=Botrimarina mediterranea TaxID=2528022 RepID=A0A518KCH8_9BACT|nr:hypothetical protein Spa11_37120 [Botrimarina mediterranea]QDV80127.1 hypothetical protein K2D_37510 [Planctomycetes bacterium K2D]